MTNRSLRSIAKITPINLQSHYQFFLKHLSPPYQPDKKINQRDPFILIKTHDAIIKISN